MYFCTVKKCKSQTGQVKPLKSVDRIVLALLLVISGVNALNKNPQKQMRTLRTLPGVNIGA